MVKPEIRIEKVEVSKSNANTYRLELRKEGPSTSSNSILDLTLGGRERKYVSWLPVDLNFLEAYGYDFDPVTMTIQGNNLFNEHLTRVKDLNMIDSPEKTFPEEFPMLDLFIVEQFEPFWDTQDGKKNPSTNVYICKEGKKIYRNCMIKYADDADSTDTFIQSDGSTYAGVDAKADPLVEMMSTELAD